MNPSPEPGKPEEQTAIPVVEEELHVGTKTVETGVVRVHKRVHENVRQIDVPLLQDSVEIRRVNIDRIVETVPSVRTEGDTIIVPIVAEELVISKRLVLKQEIHLIRRQTEINSTQDVTLRREEAEVERVDL